MKHGDFLCFVTRIVGESIFAVRFGSSRNPGQVGILLKLPFQVRRGFLRIVGTFLIVDAGPGLGGTQHDNRRGDITDKASADESHFRAVFGKSFCPLSSTPGLSARSGVDTAKAAQPQASTWENRLTIHLRGTFVNPLFERELSCFRLRTAECKSSRRQLDPIVSVTIPFQLTPDSQILLRFILFPAIWTEPAFLMSRISKKARTLPHAITSGKGTTDGSPPRLERDHIAANDPRRLTSIRPVLHKSAPPANRQDTPQAPQMQ